jgi:hypothetical protein
MHVVHDTSYDTPIVSSLICTANIGSLVAVSSSGNSSRTCKHAKNVKFRVYSFRPVSSENRSHILGLASKPLLVARKRLVGSCGLKPYFLASPLPLPNAQLLALARNFPTAAHRSTLPFPRSCPTHGSFSLGGGRSGEGGSSRRRLEAPPPTRSARSGCGRRGARTRAVRKWTNCNLTLPRLHPQW